MSVANYQGFDWTPARFAKILDPVADKVVILAIAGVYFWQGNIEWWELLLVAMRDITVLLIAVVVAFRRWNRSFETSPLMIGKITTASQLVYLLTVLLFPQAYTLVFAVTASLSIAAAIGYLYDAMVQRRNLSVV
jgi:phosphatidylglycerophosphate synthase